MRLTGVTLGALVSVGCADWASLSADYEGAGVCPTYVVAGDTHTCLRKTSGSLWCWGDNRFGQLGTGDTVQQLAPKRLNYSGVAKVYLPAGDGDITADLAVFTCATNTDNTLWCWGDNRFGQLGSPGENLRPSPTQVVASPFDVSKASNGAGHTCALTSDERLWCWGRNLSGQLGVGDLVPREVPTAVGGPAVTFDRFSAGGRHTCARTANGEVYCWGSNDRGQLGLGAPGVDHEATPTLVPFAQSAFRLSSGAAHTCLFTSDGLVWCFGDNGLGQLGTGDTTNRSAPVAIGAGTLGQVTQVYTGNAHSCALKADGSLWCWGHNRFGQLGVGDVEPRLVPTRVDALGTDVAAAYTGGAHTCAIKTDNSVWCWGNNQYGQLGTGDSAQRLTPTQIMPQCQ